MNEPAYICAILANNQKYSFLHFLFFFDPKQLNLKYVGLTLTKAKLNMFLFLNVFVVVFFYCRVFYLECVASNNTKRYESQNSNHVSVWLALNQFFAGQHFELQTVTIQWIHL